MNPFAPPERTTPSLSEPDPAIRPMSVVAAAAWSVLAVLLSVSLASVAIAALATRAPGLYVVQFLSAFGCQLVATLVALVMIHRAYAPRIPIRALIGIRATHPGFYAIALVLAVSLQLCAGPLYDAILSKYPTSIEDEHQLTHVFTRAGSAGQIALGAVIVAVGPLIEEIFYRGALFSPLRRRYRAPAVIALTSLFFAVAHPEWQLFLPIGIVGLAMGLIRSESGSLLPAFVLHAAFNATTLLSGSAPDGSGAAAGQPVPLVVIVMAPVVTLLLLGLAHRLGQTSELARAARGKDER